MKKLSLFIVLVAIALNAFSQVDSLNTNFRNLKWGMSRNKVLNSESGVYTPSLDIDGSMTFKAKILNYPAVMIYNFTDYDELYMAVVFFTIENIENNKYIEDYNKIESALNKKYGIGKRNVEWRNRLFIDDPDMIGTSLSLEHVEFITNWNLPETSIRLIMKSSKGEIFITLVYSDLSMNKTETINLKDL